MHYKKGLYILEIHRNQGTFHTRMKKSSIVALSIGPLKVSGMGDSPKRQTFSLQGCSNKFTLSSPCYYNLDLLIQIFDLFIQLSNAWSAHCRGRWLSCHTVQVKLTGFEVQRCSRLLTKWSKQLQHPPRDKIKG